MKTVSKEIKEVIKELRIIKELSYDQVKFLFEKNNKDKIFIVVSVFITLINLIILSWNIL